MRGCKEDGQRDKDLSARHLRPGSRTTLEQQRGEQESAEPKTRDLMAAATIVVAWREGAPIDEGAEMEATRLRRDMQAVCDACVPRAGVTRRAREVY
jgi:hypothetical protein